MNLEPMQGRIIVRPAQPKQSGGLIVVQGNDAPYAGEVVASGSDLIKANDTIYFDIRKAFPIKHEGADLLVLWKDDVIAVVK